MVGPASYPDALTRLMEPVATGLEIFGVLVIVAGIIWATGRFLLRDLRSRIETGALFEDEIGIREPPPIAVQVEGEQPVAEPAGQGAG